MEMPFATKLVFALSICTLANGHVANAQPAQYPLDAQNNDVASVSQKFAKPYGYHLEPILKKLQATPDQRKKITDIVMSYKPKLEPLRQKYKQDSQEFLQWIISGMPAEQVMARQGELNSLYGTIVTQYSMMRIEIRRNLTPEQCKLFEEYRQKQGWTSSSPK